MRRRMLLAAGGALVLPAPARADDAVDVQLVMAVDVSRSIDEEEARLQREGYRSAMVDPRVLAAITGGMVGAVAVAYVEWAGMGYQQLVIPWTRIGGPADAAAWSDRLARSLRQSVSWTSISGALAFSRRVLAKCPFETTRRVVDVSGDVNERPNFGVQPGAGLEAYYRNAVIGGPGAFLVVAQDFESLGAAIRRKLIQEIAGRDEDVVPAFGLTRLGRNGIRTG